MGTWAFDFPDGRTYEGDGETESEAYRNAAAAAASDVREEYKALPMGDQAFQATGDVARLASSMIPGYDKYARPFLQKHLFGNETTPESEAYATEQAGQRAGSAEYAAKALPLLALPTLAPQAAGGVGGRTLVGAAEGAGLAGVDAAVEGRPVLPEMLTGAAFGGGGQLLGETLNAGATAIANRFRPEPPIQPTPPSMLAQQTIADAGAAKNKGQRSVQRSKASDKAKGVLAKNIDKNYADTVRSVPSQSEKIGMVERAAKKASGRSLVNVSEGEGKVGPRIFQTAIAESPKFNYFRPEEQAAVNKVVKGTLPVRAARQAGRFGLLPEVQTGLTMAGGAGLGALSGGLNPLLMAAGMVPPAIGMLGRAASNQGTKKAIKEALRTVKGQPSPDPVLPPELVEQLRRMFEAQQQ
jgi:hypothetical protein